MISLKEYLSQQNPKRGQKVLLQLEEFEVLLIRHTPVEIIRTIVFKHLHYAEYVQIGKSLVLHTTDSHGNPVSPSVFHVTLPDLHLHDKKYLDKIEKIPPYLEGMGILTNN